MKRRIIALGMAAVMALGMSTFAMADETEGFGDNDGKKWKIALTNSYVGNDWRQQMIKCATVAAEKDRYKDIVDLTVVNSENDPESQSAAIDALVAQGYDALLIDAASTTGLNPAIQRAMDAGIVCVTFDCVADVEGIYSVATDFTAMATGWANYLCSQLEPGDKIAIDTGLAGSTVGNTMYDTAVEIFNDYGLEIVTEFHGDFADGVGQQAIASVLAANPDLDGMYTQVYGETIQKAFKASGRDFIPCACYTTNAGHLAALEDDIPLCTAVNFAGQSVLALDVALKVLNGEEVEQSTLFTPDFFCTQEGLDIGYDYAVIEKDVNCWDEIPGGLMLPNMPSTYEFQISAEDVADYIMK